MKRLLFILTLALGLTGFSSFSYGDNIAPRALESFKTSFKYATEVNWSVTDNLYKANFALNGQYISAYYDADGKMIALTRNISSLQLPIALQASIKANYDCFWITDLFEVANDFGTTYYITLENADTQLILKSNSGSTWSNYKRQRKS